MNKEAYNGMLGVIDDAISLAEGAVKLAETQKSPRPAETVTLVKVAAEKCRTAASALMRTGTVRGITEDRLAKDLEQSSPTELLEIMEKLASMAAFPIDADMAPGGHLVEKADATRAKGGSAEDNSVALWDACCRNAGLPGSAG